MKPNYAAIALEFIRANPGASGREIADELMRRSRAARWFGAESILTALFGPGPGTTYAILADLESAGRITSGRGLATQERGGHRPRHYFVKQGQ
jgi:DNA-binding PadR family transcriptional regulator